MSRLALALTGLTMLLPAHAATASGPTLDKDWIACWCLGGAVCSLMGFGLGSRLEVPGPTTRLLRFANAHGGAMRLLAWWTYFFSVTDRFTIKKQPER